MVSRELDVLSGGYFSDSQTQQRVPSAQSGCLLNWGGGVALEACGWHLSLSPEWLLPLRTGFYTEDKMLPCIRKSTAKIAHQLSSSLFLDVG